MLHVVDPVPFSEDEDRAEQYRATSREYRAGRRGRLLRPGRIQQRRQDRHDPVLPARPRQRSRSSNTISRGSSTTSPTPNKTVVGLLIGRADERRLRPADPAADASRGRSPSRPNRSSTCGRCSRTLVHIDDDINVLWIVHPTNFDDPTLYAIDQFIMRGGRALIFVDPLAEMLAGGGGPSGLRRRRELEPRHAVHGLGRQFLDRPTSSRTTVTRSASAATSRPARHVGSAWASTWTR